MNNELNTHPWNKSHLLMEYNSFYTLLSVFASIFLRDIGLKFYLFVMSLVLLSGSYLFHKMNWEVSDPSSSTIWKRLGRIGANSSLNV